MSHLVSAHPWEAASASAAATSVLISMISPSEGQAAKFVRPPVGASIAEQVAYSVADRQSGGQAGRFDAEQVHHAGNAVVGRALDKEIARRLAARLELGPDSGIRRLQRAVLQVRPVAAYGVVENFRAPGVDVVVDALDPLDVRTEARPAGAVERRVHAQAGGLGRGVDQPGKRRAARKAEIVSLAVVRGRNPFRGNPPMLRAT